MIAAIRPTTLPLFLLLLLLLPVAPLAGQDTLSFGGVDLPGAEVRAQYRRVNPLAQTFTIEEVRRLPATFYDPARLIALLPGTVQTNDQANHLSVRGNTPNANLWRLEGLAIANPNHTSNAGTFYDFPTLNGGGVNALSAQVLDNSAFVAGGLPAHYGYSTGGTFDLRLRPGNKTRRQYQLQAGFIGFDGAAEGPIGRQGRTSYLVNGRYSFTGLLADAGVDFGGETIRFSDLNVHLHHRHDRGDINLFLVGGSSTNLFRPDPDEPVSEQKELFAIDYANDLLIVGGTATLESRLGKFSYGFAKSLTRTERTQVFATSLDLTARSTTRLDRLSSYLNFERNLSAAATLQVGMEILDDDLRVNSSFYDFGNFTGRRAGAPFTLSFAPNASLHYFWDETDVRLGLRAVHYATSGAVEEWVLEPRLRLRRRWDGQRLIATLERNSRPPYAGLLLRRTDFAAFLPHTDQLSLAYGRSLGGVSLLGTVYYQRTPEEYAAEDGDFLVSANNFLEFDPSYTFAARTATRRYGGELEAAGGRRSEGWYYRGSLSVFRAETRQRDGDWSKDRYSNDFAGKLTLGREWTAPDRRERERTYGLNLALIAHGGERTGRVRAAFSGNVSAYFAAVDLSDGFFTDYGTYFRPDLRLYKTKVRPRTTTTLALDLQNVAGIRNVAGSYYDVFLLRPNDRLGLGLIPVLSYRILWR